MNAPGPTTSLRSKIELILNVVTVAAIVVVAGVTVNRYLTPRHVHAHVDWRGEALVGTRMTVPNVERGLHRKTLVLFLQKDCSACKVAAPLYRQLIAEASKRGVKSVAILPDSLEEGIRYLHSHDLRADQVQSENLSRYRISSIPTALVLDGEGVVRGAWSGAAPDRENETRTRVVALLEAKGP